MKPECLPRLIQPFSYRLSLQLLPQLILALGAVCIAVAMVATLAWQILNKICRQVLRA